MSPAGRKAACEEERVEYFTEAERRARAAGMTIIPANGRAVRGIPQTQ